MSEENNEEIIDNMVAELQRMQEQMEKENNESTSEDGKAMTPTKSAAGTLQNDTLTPNSSDKNIKEETSENKPPSQAGVARLKEKLEKRNAKKQRHRHKKTILTVLRKMLKISKKSLLKFANAFLLLFGARTLLSICMNLIKLLKGGHFKSVFSVSGLFGEENIVVREHAARLGLFVGSFTGLYTFIQELFREFTRVPGEFRSIFSGFLAGGSLFAYSSSPQTQRNFALYTFARALQCLYNYYKFRGHLNFMNFFEHWDALLFIISSARVMYAYVMARDTLPRSYVNFITRTGPIDKDIINATAAHNRGTPIDTNAVIQYLSKMKKKHPHVHVPTANELQSRTMIGCDILHPAHTSCSRNAFAVAWNVIRQIFPLYASLTLIPMFLLRFKRFLRSPGGSLWHALTSTIQSTAFLTAFTTVYQIVVCMHRKTLPFDHRFLFFFAGLASSSSIFIEKRSRRSELALYVMPRALDSWYTSITGKWWYPFGPIPYGEVFLFGFAMAMIMFCYEHHSESVAPFMNSALNWIMHRTQIVQGILVNMESLQHKVAQLPPVMGSEDGDEEENTE